MSSTRPAWWLLLVVGAAAALGSLALPWHSEDLRLGVTVRLLMALAGVVLLVRVARAPTAEAPVIAVGVLGAGVLAYPTLLSLAAAEVGGPVVAVLGAAGHVLPLTLVQLAPVLVSGEIVGRRHRRWETLVVVVALTGVVLVALGLAGVPGSGVLLGASTVLWFGSFALAPTATWWAVRGTAGETRHRALVAGLAALVPVVVITWCLALGVVAADLGADVAVTALLVGFAVGTCACGLLVLGARGAATSPVLGTGAVIGALHALVTTLVLLVGTVAALGLGALGVPATWAVGVGAAAMLAAGLPWLRLDAWARRVVDPAVGLRHELARLGPVDDGQHRQATRLALRRVVGDPGLTVAYDGDPAAPGRGVVLARHADGSPAVVAHASAGTGPTRLEALGDCSELLRPAVLEARLESESRRADLAADAERRRVTQDLHDGLQGRLLGLALHLQLGAQSLGDPEVVLLADETVAGLRAAVDDVRALGGGLLPEQLVRDGLRPALTAFLAPLGSLVELDVPAHRLPPEVEATAYFVVGEAVSNAVKHAGADHVRATVCLAGPDEVTVTVHDDGHGGADPRLGSGLRGLAERVSSAGGVLVVHDASPGTTVEAVLPCGS